MFTINSCLGSQVGEIKSCASACPPVASPRRKGAKVNVSYASVSRLPRLKEATLTWRLERDFKSQRQLT